MTLTDYHKKAIRESHAAGISSREIAWNLGIGKSTVNDYLNRNFQRIKKPKILLIDTETSAAKVYTFNRFNANFGQDHVHEEGGKILVASWKWLDESEVHAVYMTPKQIKRGDDRKVVEKLYRVYRQADAIVAHNAKRFDHKVIQTRGLVHNLGMLPTVKVLDTYEVAKRRLKLPSNSLDSIAAYFKLGRKTDSGGISQWGLVQEGDKEAMTKMVDYCKDDVLLLEKVFLKLRGLGFLGYNAGHHSQDGKACKACGSPNLKPTGRTVKTAAAEYSEHQCDDCGHVQRDKTMVNSKDKRKNMFA